MRGSARAVYQMLGSPCGWHSKVQERHDMSTSRRAYTLLKAYVGREWDRFSGLEEELARKELNEALDRVKPREEPVATESRSEKDGSILVPLDPEAQKTYARSLLGVSADAKYEVIRAAYQRLNKRSDPSNFPADSPEARQAALIQKKVYWAFSILSEGIDDTERRFRSIEL